MPGCLRPINIGDTREKIFRLLSVAVAIAFATASIQAYELQFDHVMLEADVDDVNDFDLDALQIRYLNPVTDNVSVMGVFALGISDDEISDNVPLPGPMSLGVDLSNMFGVYVRGHLDPGVNAMIYWPGRPGTPRL